MTDRDQAWVAPKYKVLSKPEVFHGDLELMLTTLLIFLILIPILGIKKAGDKAKRFIKTLPLSVRSLFPTWE